MKIYLIGGSDVSIKCGVMDYTNELQKALNNQGIEVFNIGNSASSCNESVILDWKRIGTYWILSKKIKDAGGKLIHIQYPAKAYGKHIGINLMPLFCRMKGMKVVFTSHEYSNRSLLGRIRQWPSFFAANKIVLVEPMFEKDLSRFPFFKNKTTTICIGSNIRKSLKSNDEIYRLRKKIVENNRKIMSYFGFVNEFKCFKEIIEALHLLKERGKLNCVFLIIGELKKEDSYHAQVLEMIDKYNLKEDVYITGYLEDGVGDYFRASDFCILPFVYGVSVRNGSFLAAYQEGIDIITSKPTGQGFPYDDVTFLDDNCPESIAKAILCMQIKDNHCNSRSVDFDWESIAKKHIELYKTL